MAKKHSTNMRPKNKRKDLQWGCVMVFLFVALFFLLISLPPFFNPKKGTWERRAQTALREYGETQKLYRQYYGRRGYGSWDELINGGFVVSGYNRGNLAENYSVWESVNNPVSFPFHSTTDTPIPSFTAIAFPRTTRPSGYLATFAIREDQVLRVYRTTTEGAKQWGEDDDFGGRTWQPIR